MTVPNIPGIISDLAALHASRNLAHTLELAECRAALRAASELLQRKDKQIERLMTTAFQLMDEINQKEKIS